MGIFGLSSRIPIVYLLLFKLVHAYVIDNDIIEAPNIICNDQTVQFSFRTKNPFRGNVYVRGQFGLPQCRREFYNNDYNEAVFEVPVGECGMTKSKQLNPIGIKYNLVIMTSFHPRFVTKVDRSYNIICFYKQMEKPVGVDIEIAEPPPMDVQKDAIMYPDCEYSMRMDTYDGPVAPPTVRVGDLIVHRWDCGMNNRDNIFGMLVKNCKVYDGGDEGVVLIDERGCPTKTSVIQSPPSYDESLTMAYAPVFAFSFPDRTQMNFRCQIQACNKVDNECVGLTPPQCGPVDTPVGVPPQPSGYPTLIPEESMFIDQANLGNEQHPPSLLFPPPNPYPAGGSYPSGQSTYNNGHPIPTYRPTTPFLGTGVSPIIPTNSPSYVPMQPQMNPMALIAKRNRQHQNNNKVSLFSRRRAYDQRQRLRSTRLETHQLQGATTFDADEDTKNPIPASELILLQKTNRRVRANCADPSEFFQPLDKDLLPENNSEQRSERQRRAEAKTMDVVSKPLGVINDNGLDESFGNVKKNARKPVPHSELYTYRSREESFCMDRNMFTALLASTSFLVAICLAFAAYIFYDQCMRKQKFDGICSSFRCCNFFRSCWPIKGKSVIKWPSAAPYSFQKSGSKRLSEIPTMSSPASSLNLGQTAEQNPYKEIVGITSQKKNPASTLAQILNGGILTSNDVDENESGLHRIAKNWGIKNCEKPPSLPPKPF